MNKDGTDTMPSGLIEAEELARQLSAICSRSIPKWSFQKQRQHAQLDEALVLMYKTISNLRDYQTTNRGFRRRLTKIKVYRHIDNVLGFATGWRIGAGRFMEVPTISPYTNEELNSKVRSMFTSLTGRQPRKANLSACQNILLRRDEGLDVFVEAVADFQRDVDEVFDWTISRERFKPFRRMDSGLFKTDFKIIDMDIPVRDVASWFDVQLVRRWLDHCDRFHAEHCSAVEQDRSIFCHWPMYLIDVSRKCLVDATVDMRYLALSYVWGSGSSFHTLKGNVNRLKKEGFVNLDLAPTIQHVIEITRLIGERYVWIDALCIIQDDELHKEEHIQSMGSIYANAYGTVIAAAGTAFDGLRGVEGFTPPMERRRHELWEITMRDLIEAHEVDMHDTLWNKRGWTFQEQVFSRRIIIIGKYEISWQCHCSIWFEGHEPYGTHVCADNRESIVRAFNFRPEPNLDDLYRHVCQHNRRDLTYPEDILDAFGGIMNTLSVFYPGGFIQGLPICLFDAALLWSSSGDLTKRCPKRSALMPPSWSWAAWQGLIDQWHRSVVPLVEWSYKADRSSPSQALSATDTGIADQVLGKVQGPYAHILHSRPLRCTTSIERKGSNLYCGKRDGMQVCINQIDRKSDSLPLTCELVAISESEDSIYNALWVEWHGDIAYRKGLVSVSKHFWAEQDGSQERIDLVLG